MVRWWYIPAWPLTFRSSARQNGDTASFASTISSGGSGPNMCATPGTPRSSAANGPVSAEGLEPHDVRRALLSVTQDVVDHLATPISANARGKSECKKHRFARVCHHPFKANARTDRGSAGVEPNVP